MTRPVVHFTDASLFGGAEQMILTLITGLDRRRWHPILLHHGEPTLAELIDGSRRLDMETVRIPRRGARRAIKGFLRRARPAVFHAHLNWPLACSAGLVAAALARIPAVIATQQLLIPIQSRRRVLRHKLLSLGVDRYIAVSHHMAGMLRKVCLFGDRKVRVVHNGVSPAPFEQAIRAELRGELRGVDGRPIVLTLARLVPQKGIGYLIEAAARVPDALFAIAGDGPERSVLEEKAEACGVSDRVVFLGHRGDAPALLASCDLFVLPSLYEGLPVSVLEAMASGRPVIATGVGGTNEAVQAECTGLVVPPADPEALARAIRRLLGDRALAQRLGAEAQRRVRREFSNDVMAAGVEGVYREALGETGAVAC